MAVATLVTGLLIFLIHPTVIFGIRFPDLGFMAWVHLVPLLVALRSPQQSLKSIFGWSLAASSLGYYGLLYWLVTAMKGFGGMSWIQALGALTALVVTLSLVFALCLTLAFLAARRAPVPFWVAILVALLARDAILHYFPFGGYPWGIPAYSQGRWLDYFQWIDITGIGGLSLLIYLANALATEAYLGWRVSAGHIRGISVWAGSMVFLFLASWGLSHLSRNNFEKNRAAGPPIRIALVQANIAQDVKWNPKLAQRIIKKHVELTQKAMASQPDVILWPETAYTLGIQSSQISAAKILEFQGEGIHILTGTSVRGPGHFYNAVMHVEPTGMVNRVYRKIHLVPFGEYLPFREWLTFMEGLSQGIGHFDVGTEYVLFDVQGVRFAPLICIEDIFPRYAARFTRAGADVLVNFTNDGWYGDSSAMHQHLVYSQLRALENRKPLVRATNTGVSAVVDAYGRVVASIPPLKEGVLVHSLTLRR